MKSIFNLRRVVACSDTVHMMIDRVPMGQVYRYDGKWWHVFDGFGAASGPFKTRWGACRDFEDQLPEHALALLIARNRERSEKIAGEFNARVQSLRLPK